MMNRVFMWAVAATLMSTFAFAQDNGDAAPAAGEESGDAATAAADGEATPEPAPVTKAEDPFSLEFDISDTEKIKLKFWGQMRTRYGNRSPGTYAGTAPQEPRDNFLFRTRFGIKASFPASINILFEVQDNRTWGSEPRAASNSGSANNFDVLQAHLHTPNLFDQGIEMWLGRQKFTVGKQRLWSTLEWSNSSRTWDGLRLSKSFMDDQFDVQVFAMLIDENARPQDDEWNLGMTVNWQPDFLEGHEFELFTLYQTTDNASGTGDANVATISLRWDGKFDLNEDMGFDFGIEGVVQTGKSDSAFWYGGTAIDNANVSTGAAAITVGFVWTASEAHKFRFGLGYDYASGDSDPTDEKFQTFRSPFPFGHKYQGYADQAGWRNLRDMYVNVKWTYTGLSWAKALIIELAGHSFARDNDDDGWYNVGGGVIRTGTNQDSDDIGSEIDIVATLKVNRWIDVQVGLAMFMAGGFVKDTATDTGNGADNEESGMTFFWTQLTFKF
ncbi:MAG: alginate export family protein [Planctomycetes bacterium]|nr:alginate export family protein [Planctomycetota bacterium]